MNLFKSNAWILMRSGTVALPFILLLAIVFNVLWLQKSLDPNSFRYVKTYLLITCLPALFYGLLLAVGLQKLKAHYLWVVNDSYRIAILKAALLLASSGAFITSLCITLTSELPLYYLLLPTCFAIIGLFINTGNSMLDNILRHLLCCALLLLLMFERTHEVTQLVLLIVCGYTLFNAFKKPNSKAKNNSPMVTFERQSAKIWNQKLATFTAKFKKSFNKDIAWAVSYPQTKLGYLGGYFAAIFGLLFATTDSEVLTSFMLLSLVLGCQFPVYQEFHQLRHQIKAVAHCFIDNQHLIKEIIYAFDKIVVRNTLLIFAAMFTITLFKHDAQQASKMAFLTLFATAIFLALAPLLVVYFSGCINVKNIALFAVICVLEVGVFGLVHYTSDKLSIYLIAVMVLLSAMTIRYYTQRFITRQPLEHILS